MYFLNLFFVLANSVDPDQTSLSVPEKRMPNILNWREIKMPVKSFSLILNR